MCSFGQLILRQPNSFLLCWITYPILSGSIELKRGDVYKLIIFKLKYKDKCKTVENRISSKHRCLLDSRFIKDMLLETQRLAYNRG